MAGGLPRRFSPGKAAVTGLDRYPRDGDQPPTGEKHGIVIPKLMTAIMAPLFIAPAITVLSAPTAHVEASPGRSRKRRSCCRARNAHGPICAASARRTAIRTFGRSAPTGWPRSSGADSTAPKYCLECAVHCLLLESNEHWVRPPCSFDGPRRGSSAASPADEVPTPDCNRCRPS